MVALWSGEFREDWRYGFAVGRLRVLQTHLLESGRVTDLANSVNMEEMLSRLSGTAYAPSAEATGLAEQIETRLRDLRREAYKLVTSLSLDEALRRFIQGPEDFRNIKILLRQNLIENSPTLQLSDLAYIGPEQLTEIFEAEKYDALPQAMAQAIQRAIVAYYEDKNPRNIDLELDRGVFLYRRELAGELKNEYLLSLCGLLADLANIRSMARLKWLEEDRKLLGQAYLPGGSVELSRLQSALTNTWEAIPGLFFVTPYAELIEHGLAFLAANDSFLRLEKYSDDYLGEFLRSSNQVIAGPEPLVAYILGVERDIRSVRLIFSAKQAGMNSETIRDRLTVG
ncbi:MAG: hypothetical protein GWP14_03460 [Actinobacteria bacterium]|nr:hypothetical protein [Actinomycetota bacterium]